MNYPLNCNKTIPRTYLRIRMQQNKNDLSIQVCIFDFLLIKMLLFRFRVHPFILFHLKYSGSPSVGSSSLVRHVLNDWAQRYV